MALKNIETKNDSKHYEIIHTLRHTRASNFTTSRLVYTLLYSLNTGLWKLKNCYQNYSSQLTDRTRVGRHFKTRELKYHWYVAGLHVACLTGRYRRRVSDRNRRRSHNKQGGDIETARRRDERPTDKDSNRRERRRQAVDGSAPAGRATAAAD